MAKSGCDLCPPIDSSHRMILGISSQFQGFFNHRGKIALFPDVYHFRISHHFCSKYTVSIVRFRRHQAVGRKQNRSRNILKFFLLVLPSGSKISFQVRVGFEFRIGMCGQHLAMRINVNPSPLCLFQQCMQIKQIMAGYNDKWPLLYGQRHCGRLWRSVSLCICPVQQFHAFQIDASRFQHQWQEVFHIRILPDGKQPAIEEVIYFLVRVTENTGMVSVSGHTSKAKEQNRLEGPDVHIRLVPKLIHVVICIVRTRGSATATSRKQRLLFCMDGIYLALHNLRVKANICNRSK